MARKKLSEFRSKVLVNSSIGTPYAGWQIQSVADTKAVKGYETYVVKVDQAVKGRFKKGLVLLHVQPEDITSAVQSLFDKGFDSILVEPEITHNQADERYLSFDRRRDGIVFSYSDKGGVDIEKNEDSVQTVFLEEIVPNGLSKKVGLNTNVLRSIFKLFNDMHISFLEINPYMLTGETPTFLDVAIEVDATAELLVDGWNEGDIRIPSKKLSKQESLVGKLNKESAASFSLETINSDGSIFLLLSGGGASVVIADEIYTRGFGDQLANYGEYSGNPSEDETYVYTQQVLGLIMKSKSRKKVLFVGGAVANFTDIATTFKGVIRALKENSEQLTSQKVRVYVRRGGPHQDVGLRNIEKTLRDLDIYGGVYDPTTSIPVAVENLLKGLK